MELGQKNWYAIYTRYRCEKKVMETMLSRNVEAYTPLLTRKVQYSKKVKTHHYPLLPNYVFVRISDAEKIKVLNTQHVVSFVMIGAELPKVRQQEINWLKKIVGENQAVEVLPKLDAIGEKVEIVSGALTGLKGQLVQINNKKEFIVKLESMAFNLKLSVEATQLRLIPSRVA